MPRSEVLSSMIEDRKFLLKQAKSGLKYATLSVVYGYVIVVYYLLRICSLLNFKTNDSYVNSIVQAILAVPCLYGFAALVFSDEVYEQHMAGLAKVFIFSSFIHAVCIAVFSPLPFAIGQVQDAGLIFFSSMASNIAFRMKGQDSTAVVSTAMVTIALSTTMVGLCLILLGKAKLASLVSYLPMPVVGGYLAFIGLFCVEAGLSLATGVSINGISTWYLLFESDDNIVLVIPALASAIGLCLVSRFFTHIAALPGAICCIPLVFYSILFVCDISFEEAREFGWLGENSDVADWQSVFEFYDLSLVHWSVVPYQIPTWIGMVMVIAFGSSLDIAAVEMGTGVPLDTDEQLVTIGLSNLITGCTGGFAGSYIFTQTLLGFRTRFHKRSVALIMAVVQLIVFSLATNPLSFIPLFFFAATIIFIGFDLLFDWIWEV